MTIPQATSCGVCGVAVDGENYYEPHRHPAPGPRVYFCDGDWAAGVFATPNREQADLVDVTCGGERAATV